MIGSYDKQLWEQSVERKLQKQPPFVLHNAPRKKVRLKTEYIDVDLIRGSTFAKTKPQVPWVYITRKAVARVLFFPFYYNWWVHQTSKRLYALLLVLYILQVVTVIVYLRNYDHGIMEDELCFTEVILPTFLMFLLCLIHSQTVLAHINHKPPKRNKNISGVTRKPRPKKASRKGRSSGNNSTCPEDGANTDTSRASRRKAANQPASDIKLEPHSLSTDPDAPSKKSQEAVITSSIDVEKNLMSHSAREYELISPTASIQNDLLQSVCSSLHSHTDVTKNDAHLTSNWHHDRQISLRKQNDHHDKEEEQQEVNVHYVHNILEDQQSDSAQSKVSECSCILKDNLSYSLTVRKVCSDTNIQSDHENKELAKKLVIDKYCHHSPSIKLRRAHLMSEEKRCNNSDMLTGNFCVEDIRHDNSRVNDYIDVSKNVGPEDEVSESVTAYQTGSERDKCASLYGVLAKTHALLNNEDVNLGLKLKACTSRPPIECNVSKNVHSVVQSNQHHGVSDASYDNLSMSDFEMVEGHENHKENSSHTSPNDFSCSFIEAWKNDLELQNTIEATKPENNETLHVQDNNVRCKPRPFKSQDSSDSGINNEVPGVDCSCGISHKDCTQGNNWQTTSTSGVEDVDGASLTSGARYHQSEYDHQAKLSDCDNVSLLLEPETSKEPSYSLSDPSTVKAKYLSQISTLSHSHSNKKDDVLDHQSSWIDTTQPQSPSEISFNPSIHQNENAVSARTNGSQTSTSEILVPPQVSESSSQLQCFSELFVQEILNEDTLREMSCSSLLAHSDLENSSSSVGRLSTASTSSSASNSSSCCKMCHTHHIPSSTKASENTQEPSDHHHHHQSLQKHQHGHHERVKIDHEIDDEKIDQLDESLEHLNASDGERPSDDVSNYNPSDSDADSDGPVNEDVCKIYEEKWKRLRFQEFGVGSDNTVTIMTSKASTNIAAGTTVAKAASGSILSGGGSRSGFGILTRKPSPLKDLAISRKPNSNVPITNFSGSDQNPNEVRNQLRRRRRTSGTPSEPVEASRTRSVPTTLGMHPSAKTIHISSSENETGGARTPDGSNKATMSSEEWEDRMQSDETTSSAYSSNSEVDSEEKVEEEEKTEYTTSTLHVINLLQPGVQPSCVSQSIQQSGSPSSSGNITQPDRVSCVIWEGSECKKVDLTALDIGWAIIDKVDSLPESSDYFLIGLSFSFFICMVPLVFRAYASKDSASLEDFLSWSGIMTKFSELIRNSYSWRQYLLMVNGILQRFFLSLIFFFLLSVADRTFKQRLLYAKHFSYLTSSRRARKFSMPHFRLNKVRNIKIWLSLRSYLKRRGPQRSVDVIVSACFLCAVCTVCLISLQMLKDTDSYLDYLCNWELLVWCTALGVFLMRFMTVGLKINKKYRNLSVLITEQINLYLQMEQKPHKKEELILANNVLRLAEDLLKELESPFKISGFSANPLIYNIMRVVVLSAFSAVLTEVLGFKLKLHKIKLKA